MPEAVTPTPGRGESVGTVARPDRDTSTWFAYSLIVCLFIPLGILIVGDRSVWSWDLALYAQQSVELHTTLIRSPGKWVARMLTIGYDRPIAIAWLGQFFVPLGRSLNSVQSGLLFLTLFTELLSVLLLLKSLLKLFGSRGAAVLSCVFVLAGPLFVGLGFRYFVEPLQGLAVVWLVAVAALHQRLGRVLLACHVVAAILFGLAVKPTTGFFQAPLLPYLAYLWSRSPWGPERGSRLARVHLAVGAAATLLLAIGTLGWYALHYRYVIEHVVDASSGAGAEAYGTRAPWLVKLPYWLRELQRNFCATFLLPYLGVLFAVAVFKSRSRWGLGRPGDVLAGISLGWILVTAAVFALNVNDHSRYLMALFPYVGIVICWTLEKMRSWRWWGVFGALCALQLMLVLARAGGFISPFNQFTGYLGSWERSSAGLENVYYAVDQTCEPGSISAVGVELPKFNAEALNFYAAVRHPEVACSYFGLPAHETQLAAEVVWTWLNRKTFRYYLYRTFTDAGGYEWLNKFSRVVLANIKESPAVRARPDKSNSEVVVFESYHPLHPGDKVVRGVGPERELPFGYLEEPLPAAALPQKLAVSGWAVAGGGVRGVDACFSAIGTDKRTECRPVTLTALGHPRADVAKAYPSVPGSLRSGFQGSVNVMSFPKGRYQLALVVHGRDGSAREVASIPIYVKPFFAPGASLGSRESFPR